MAGLWGAGDYIFVLARYLGCIIGRWLLCSGGCLLRFHCINISIWGVHEHHNYYSGHLQLWGRGVYTYDLVIITPPQKKV